jgi:4-aminobutyrate aminotransferase-like enzyme
MDLDASTGGLQTSPVRRPTISPSTAAKLAAEHFGLRGEVRELDSYADRNFRIAGHVLKVAFASADLDMEVAAMDWLAEPARSGAVTPTVRRSPEGHAVVDGVDEDGRPVRVRAASFVPGRLLADVSQPSRALWRDLGRRAGQLGIALDGFDHPGLHRGHDWDLAQASWISLGLDIHPRGRRRDLIRSALLQYRGRVLPRAGALRRGAIHGDLNEANLLTDDAGSEIVGIFDFGDMCASWLIAEVAIAAAYAMILSEPADALDTLTAVAAGYHEVRPLGTLECDVLLDLVRVRLAVSITAGEQARRAEPENAYAGTTVPGAIALLDTLAEIDDRRAIETLCGKIGIATPDGWARADGASLLERRKARLGGSLSLAYSDPLHIVRGQGTWLFDENDRAHLDCVNNVCHVGHCEPRVVRAASEQMSRLNTNTRYLHENVVEYAERLSALFPDPLEVCFFVCSGSEANELAIRIARAATGRRDVIAVEHGYHGNTSTLVDLSSYKHNGPGGTGAPDWVHTLPVPDPRRGALGDDGPGYAAALRELTMRLHDEGRPPAAFLCESVLGCAGQVFPASGFLPAAFEHARAAGAVCIADEVQIGFGRIGPMFWGFAREGAVPDIVTMGKPIGNGHPLGAVITTRALADRFANGMEYFNTFGGNPVSAAVGLAVLDVIEEDGLARHAEQVGRHLLERLRPLLEHESVTDIRGEGLFVGIELADQPRRVAAMVDHAKARGVLVSIDGPKHDVIKIKPPLTFDLAEADALADVLACGLANG